MERRSIRWTLIAAAVVVAGSAFAMYRHSQLAPVQRDTVSSESTPRPIAVALREKTAAKPTRAAADTYYMHAIRGNLFSPPIPPAPHVVAPKPSPHVAMPAPPKPDPLADAVYAGSFTEDGKTLALIQSRATNAGEYVRPGDRWHGFTIRSVSPSDVKLARNGSSRTLKRSDTINVVQLNASAPTPKTTSSTGAKTSTSSTQYTKAVVAAWRRVQAQQRRQQWQQQRQQRNQQRAMRSMYQRFQRVQRAGFGGR